MMRDPCQPSPSPNKVGLHIVSFGASTVFMYITACQFAGRPDAACCPSGFDGFVASTAAEVATRSGRPWPRRDPYPLEHSALARRTWAATDPSPKTQNRCLLIWSHESQWNLVRINPTLDLGRHPVRTPSIPAAASFAVPVHADRHPSDPADQRSPRGDGRTPP